MDIIQFKAPWKKVESDIEKQQIILELNKEINSTHVLNGKTVTPIAKRIDTDNIIFLISNGLFALVHLTWSGKQETDNNFPYTEFSSNIYELLDDE